MHSHMQGYGREDEWIIEFYLLSIVLRNALFVHDFGVCRKTELIMHTNN